MQTLCPRYRSFDSYGSFMKDFPPRLLSTAFQKAQNIMSDKFTGFSVAVEVLMIPNFILPNIFHDLQLIAR